MAWHSISMDELRYQQLQYQGHIAPVLSVTEYLNAILEGLLEDMGVDCSQPNALIGFQQQLLGINVVDLSNPEDIVRLCREGNYSYNDGVKGIYIFKNMVPLYFIPDPGIKNGLAGLGYFDFIEDTLIDVGTVRIPQG